tara:strand:+ start:309 stop:539 length:231 start_codon:yes stop_codon:yes gene_type:complete
MTEKQKEKSMVRVDDKEYDVDSFSDEQKAMVNHIMDLERKLQTSEFNLVQLRFGRQAFTDALKASLTAAKDKVEEK